MTDVNINNNKKYVVLQSIEYGSRFFSTHSYGVDPTLSENGEKWYDIIGWADTIAEAQAILLCGRAADRWTVTE